jgi:hypothetical protein
MLKMPFLIIFPCMPRYWLCSLTLGFPYYSPLYVLHALSLSSFLCYHMKNNEWTQIIILIHMQYSPFLC